MTIDAKVIDLVIKHTIAIQRAVFELSALYDDHPELNDMQPDITEDCYAMSLDEWGSLLDTLPQEWRNIQDIISSNKMVAIYEGECDEYVVCTLSELASHNSVDMYQDWIDLLANGNTTVGGGAFGWFHYHLVP